MSKDEAVLPWNGAFFMHCPLPSLRTLSVSYFSISPSASEQPVQFTATYSTISAVNTTNSYHRNWGKILRPRPCSPPTRVEKEPRAPTLRCSQSRSLSLTLTSFSIKYVLLAARGCYLMLRSLWGITAATWCSSIIFMTSEKKYPPWNVHSGGEVTPLNGL